MEVPVCNALRTEPCSTQALVMRGVGSLWHRLEAASETFVPSHLWSARDRVARATTLPTSTVSGWRVWTGADSSAPPHRPCSRMRGSSAWMWGVATSAWRSSPVLLGRVPLRSGSSKHPNKNCTENALRLVQEAISHPTGHRGCDRACWLPASLWTFTIIFLTCFIQSSFSKHTWLLSFIFSSADSFTTQ